MTDQPRVEPIWLDAKEAIAIHDRQLAEHGGGTGIRDIGLLESALGRPINQWHYGENDPAALAAAYAFGVARNHPFIDGNKRTAWIAARLFLVMNGHVLSFDAADAIRTVLALASGDLSEDELASWFRDHLSTD
ncbi:MAG: death-on-curing protein [Sphingomonadales bacterium]|nr:death-on-curing protein [Sphingomonadales bacterium]